jgi:hypothetical protein
MSTPLIQPEQPPGATTPYADRGNYRLGGTIAVFLVCLAIPVYIFVKLRSVLDDERKSRFIYHPLLMTLGVVALPLAAILQQRLFGYRSKKIHAYSMILSLILVACGAYVIISEKNEKGESHFDSWHSIIGLCWIVFAFLECLGGLITLDPDFRIAWFTPTSGSDSIKRFVTARSFHQVFGRILVIIGYVATLLGWYLFFGSDKPQMWLVGSVLTVLIGVLLFDPINDLLVFRRRFRINTSPRD